MTKKDIGLMVAIVFASSVVSGGLVYYGAQVSAGDLSTDMLSQKIDEGVERYVQKKQEEAIKAQEEAQAEQVKTTKEQAKNVPPVSDSDHIYGEKDARISLIEYSDFQCPYCARFNATPKEVIEKYEGKVNWVYRNFPLNFHEPNASKQAVAAECAAKVGGNDMYWEYEEVLYTAGPTEDNDLVAAAEDLGMDGAEFKTCLGSGEFDELIKQQLEDGSKSGVTGTPGTIVLDTESGDAVVISGAQPASAFEKVIDEMLGEE